MENWFFRIFRSSFGSCRPKDITAGVVEKPPPPIFLTGNSRQRHHHRNHQQQLIQLFSPKPPRPFPSAGCSKSPPVSQSDDQKSPLAILTEATAAEGQKYCPPVTPISPLLNAFYYEPDCDRLRRQAPKPKDKKSKKSKRPTTRKFHRSRSNSFGLDDEFPALSYNGLFSSDEDDDDDKTMLFSSRSLSSDSSDSLRRSRSCRITNPKNHHHHRQRRVVGGGDGEIMGFRRYRTATVVERLMVEGSKVKDSFAVVKRSSDPYNDFRTSMVEMIVERQIFSADELEKLLQCFLSLNSYHHHHIIVEVFTEIWEALFSNWS